MDPPPKLPPPLHKDNSPNTEPGGTVSMIAPRLSATWIFMTTWWRGDAIELSVTSSGDSMTSRIEQNLNMAIKNWWWKLHLGNISSIRLKGLTLSSGGFSYPYWGILVSLKIFFTWTRKQVWRTGLREKLTSSQHGALWLDGKGGRNIFDK